MTSVIAGQRSGNQAAIWPAGRALVGPDGSRVRIRRASASDLPAVMTMVSRCSGDTLFHRFHGPALGAELTRDQLVRPGMIVYLAWTRQRCVAVAVLGFDDRGVGHLGVLVEDAWQRHGVGSRLTRALVAQAREDGVRILHADVLVEDSFLLPLLRRMGPVSLSTAMGTHSVDISLSSAPVSCNGSC